MADGVTPLAAASGTPFDMIVVGGGITGCGVALDAALRGLKVALVEQDDIASGTSSRSSRLVHGGVRYLEHGHLRLVFEASAERRRLLQLAPHLVRPLEFTWPVYQGARVPKWKLAAGLVLYDALAVFRNVGRHRRLGVAELRREQPMLADAGLTGGAAYWDASTDDTRLALAVALEAEKAGAVILTHTRATALEQADGRATGIQVEDQLTGEKASLAATVIVNATGPWSDRFRRLESARDGLKVHGSKGVHISVAAGRVGNRGALTLLSPVDGRVMFVLPAGTQTIIGTTDTFTDAPPAEVRATEGDVEYLLEAANVFFPGAALRRSDVIAAWAGVRPLAAPETGTDSVAASREHDISVTPAGVVTVTGGKLTTYRVMAEETVDAALRLLSRRIPARTATAHLAWQPGRTLAAVEAEASRETGDAGLAARLVGAYGQAWRVALDTIRRTPGGLDHIEPGLPYRMGEIVYSIRHEMARTLGDLLIRRMHVAFETPDNGRAAARRVIPLASSAAGWSAEAQDGELRRYDDEVGRMFSVDAG